MKKAKRKKIFFYFLTIFIILFAIVYSGVEAVDTTPYIELPCYAQTNNAISNLTIQKLPTQKGFLVGWSKQNITPTTAVSFAGYGFRHQFDGVHDSLFVRAIVIENNIGNGIETKGKIAIVSMDLLIVHPDLANNIREKIKILYPEITMVYFTATHTHHGIGGWAKGIAGIVSMGGYDENIFQLLVNQTITAISQASKNTEVGSIGYGQILAQDFVSHRIEKNSPVDAWLRMIKFKKQTGKEAVLLVYNAHNNGLRHDMPLLSNDYVGALLADLKNKVDFPMFASGMVASHRWNGQGDDYASVEKDAKKLAILAALQIPLIKTKKIEQVAYTTLAVEIRKPQFRITDKYKLSTWLFEALLGKLQAYISCVKIGDIVLLGMPCDFSGELFAEIATVSKSKKQQLVITSFNGAYIGYISHDKWYQHHASEIRDMNWVAPESAWYFTDIAKKLLKKID